MLRLATILGLVLGLGGAALADTQSYYPDYGTKTVQGAAVIPFPFVPLCPESHGVSLASATTLTAASMLPTGFPTATRSCTTTKVTPRYCVVTAETATVYYTLDGSTTAAAGKSALTVGSTMPLVGNAQILAADFYSATGTLDVQCSQ